MSEPEINPLVSFEPEIGADTRPFDSLLLVLGVKL